MVSTGGKLGSFLRDVRVVMARQRAAPSDAELLRQYTSSCDHGAFAALVERHGGLVLALCRRILRHTQDAEDAFQATFLVLARKAGAIRKHESVAGWLHSVAFRVAHKLRANGMRRKQRESTARAAAQVESADDLSWREVQLAVGEELNRLANKYRSPLVLCYLEGKSRDEAAQELGLTLDVFRGRLERAREALRSRLKRRGLELSAALLALGVAEAGRAAVPSALLSSTLQAAGGAAPLTAAAGASAQAAFLAQGVLKAMFLSKVKLIAVGLLTLTFLGTGAGVVTYRALADEGGRGSGTSQGRLPAQQRKDDMDPVKLKRELERLRLELEATRIELEKAKLEIRKLKLDAEMAKQKGTGGFGGFSGFSGGTGFGGGTGFTGGSGFGGGTGFGGGSGFTGGGLQPAPKKEAPKADKQAAVAFSPDGKLLATADGKVFSLLDAQTGKVISRSEGHKDVVSALAFTPDGKLLASGSRDKTISIWLVPTGRQLRMLVTPGPIEAIFFSADGKTLLIRESDRTEREFDLETGKEIRVKKKQ